MVLIRPPPFSDANSGAANGNPVAARVAAQAGDENPVEAPSPVSLTRPDFRAAYLCRGDGSPYAAAMIQQAPWQLPCPRITFRPSDAFWKTCSFGNRGKYLSCGQHVRRKFVVVLCLFKPHLAHAKQKLIAQKPPLEAKGQA